MKIKRNKRLLTIFCSRLSSIFLLITVIFCLLFSLSAIVPFVFAQTNISSCQILNVENETYTFNQTIQTNQYCFVATAKNITIDGAGFSLIFNTTPIGPSFAIELQSSNQSRIFNLTIGGTGENSSGILFNSSSNNTVFNISFQNLTYGIFGSSSNNATVRNLTFVNTSLQMTSLKWIDSSGLKIVNLSGGQDAQTVYLKNISDSSLDLVHTTTQNYPSGIIIYSSRRINASRIFADDNASSITLNQTTTAILSNSSLGTIILDSMQYLIIHNTTITNPVGSLYLANVSNSLFRYISIFSGQINLWPPFDIPFVNDTFINITSSANPILSMHSTTQTEDLTGDITLINTSIDSYTLNNYHSIPLYLKISNLYGAINFSQGINGTGNFTNDVQITPRTIVVNSIPPYNQSSNISFTSLTTNYTSQKILRNGSVCFAPACILLTALNKTTVTYTVNDSGNYTLTDFGNAAPDTVSNLNATIINNNDIYWTWTNPPQVDFNGTRLYLNGAPLINLSRSISAYNTTNLTHNTAYTLQIETIDYDGNVNTTTTQFVSATHLDSVAPNTVSNFTSTYIDRDQISYSWTLPNDTDFSNLIAKLNGVILFNLSKTATNITLRGLVPNTTYNFTLISADINGNTNATSNISKTTDDSFGSGVGPFFINRCGTIIAPGIYTISAPIIQSNLTCIFIRTSNVTLDGNGSTIFFATANFSNDAYGIFTTGDVTAQNAAITNITIRNISIITNSTKNLNIINGTNSTLTALFTNQTNNLSVYNIFAQNGSVGINLSNSNYAQIENNTLAAANISLAIGNNSNSITILNNSFVNATIGAFVDSSLLINLSGDSWYNISGTFVNSTSSASLANVVIENPTFTIPSQSTTTTLFDAAHSTKITNLSVNYGSIILTNLSAQDFSGYTLRVINGNLTLISKNTSAVTFPLPATMNGLKLTSDIILGNEGITTDSIANPQLSNLTAMITFYNVNEGSPVYMIHDSLPCNPITTVACTQVSSTLNGPTVVFLTTNLSGSYSLTGYTLHLLGPADASVLNSTSVTFRFYVSPTFNRTLNNCDVLLNNGGGFTTIRSFNLVGTSTPQTYQYATSILVDQTGYNWSISCVDNESVVISATQTFSVALPASAFTPSSSGGGSSSAFGAYPGALSQWIDTYILDRTEFNQSIFVSLHLLEGVRLRVNGESHHIGLDSIGVNSATINISSTPQQATLSVNESKTIIVDENGTTGLSITLLGVDGKVANFTIAPVPVIPSNAATSSSASGANTTVSSSDNSSENSSYTSSAVKNYPQPFAPTQGIIFVVVIAGILTVCGLGYYFFLILKYKKTVSATAQSIDAPPNLNPIAKFLTLFTDWKQRTLSPQAQETKAAAAKQKQQVENSTRYMVSVVPILSMAHTAYVGQCLAAGNTFAYIEFELIQRGYTREQAKQVLQYYELDKFVYLRFLDGISAHQVEQEVRNAGWSSAIVDKMFKKIKPAMQQ